MKDSARQPKTHSEILWHFTGGPLWNSKKSLQSTKLKPQKNASEILVSILKSKVLRIGNYHEVINCSVLPSYKFYNKQTNRMVTKKGLTVTVKTSPVCCVADIPETELFHHAKRYGKFAVGFKRESLLKAGFNPVFYTLDDTKIISNFYNAQNALEQSDVGIHDFIDDIEHAVSELECEHSKSDDKPWKHDDIDCSHIIDTSDLSGAADQMREYVDEALEDLKETLAFIKTFKRTEFDTIYSEREWRSVSPFKFSWKDISKIILPKNYGFYENFLKKHKPALKIPSSIKILSWEEINI